MDVEGKRRPGPETSISFCEWGERSGEASKEAQRQRRRTADMAYHQLPDWDPLGACGDAHDDDERRPLASDTRAKHSNGAFASAATAQPFVEHTVQKGDSLRSLAVHYHTTVNSILQLNRARSEEILLMKRVIKVPNTSHASTSLFDSLKSGLWSHHHHFSFLCVLLQR